MWGFLNFQLQFVSLNCLRCFQVELTGKQKYTVDDSDCSQSHQRSFYAGSKSVTNQQRAITHKFHWRPLNTSATKIQLSRRVQLCFLCQHPLPVMRYSVNMKCSRVKLDEGAAAVRPFSHNPWQTRWIVAGSGQQEKTGHFLSDQEEYQPLVFGVAGTLILVIN